MEASGSSEENLSSESTQLIDSIPSSPPPSYEHVLAEVDISFLTNRLYNCIFMRVV